MDIRQVRWRRVSPRSLAGLPAAGVGLIFCALAIGWIGTAVVAFASIFGITLLLHIIYALKRTGDRRRAEARGANLLAEAGIDGRAGEVTIFEDSLHFAAKQGGTIDLPWSSIRTVTVAGRSIPMFVTALDLGDATDQQFSFRINSRKGDVLGAIHGRAAGPRGAPPAPLPPSPGRDDGHNNDDPGTPST